MLDAADHLQGSPESTNQNCLCWCGRLLRTLWHAYLLKVFSFKCSWGVPLFLSQQVGCPDQSHCPSTWYDFPCSSVTCRRLLLLPSAYLRLVSALSVLLTPDQLYSGESCKRCSDLCAGNFCTSCAADQSCGLCLQMMAHLKLWGAPGPNLGALALTSRRNWQPLTNAAQS